MDTEGAPVAEVLLVGAGVPVGAKKPVAEMVGEPPGVALTLGEARGEAEAEPHFEAVGEALVLAAAVTEGAAEKVGVTVSEREGVGDVEAQWEAEPLPLADTVGDAVGAFGEGEGVRETLAELEGEPEARGEREKEAEAVPGGPPVLDTLRVAPPRSEGVGVPVRVSSGEREEEGVALPEVDSRALPVPPLPVAAAEGDAVLVHVAVPPPEAEALPEALPPPPRSGERLPLPPVALTLALPVSDMERVEAEEGMSVGTAELVGVVVREPEPEPE